MGYTFTDEDLWAYLATKQDDEVVGLCANSLLGLIAEAVKEKYPDLRIGVEVYGPEGLDDLLGDGSLPAMVVLQEQGQVILLSSRLWEMQQVFDWNTGKQNSEPVTKAEFLQAWQAYQAVRGESNG